MPNWKFISYSLLENTKTSSVIRGGGYDVGNGFKEKVMLKFNVINGTIWLSKDGDVEMFSPVLGLPPASSSDMSLVQAMEKLSQVCDMFL